MRGGDPNTLRTGSTGLNRPKATDYVKAATRPNTLLHRAINVPQRTRPHHWTLVPHQPTTRPGAT